MKSTTSVTNRSRLALWLGVLSSVSALAQAVLEETFVTADRGATSQ
jgi:hypothetical protein